MISVQILALPPSRHGTPSNLLASEAFPQQGSEGTHCLTEGLLGSKFKVRP